MCVYNSCHNSRIYYQICLHLGYKFEQLFIFINTGCATLQSKMWVARVGTLSTLRKFKKKSFPILVYYGPKKKKWLMSSTFPQKQRELDIKSHQQRSILSTELWRSFVCNIVVRRFPKLKKGGASVIFWAILVLNIESERDYLVFIMKERERIYYPDRRSACVRFLTGPVFA